MITINNLLKEMDSEIPLEQRTLADLIRSMDIWQIEIRYLGGGDSGGLEDMTVYDAQGDYVRSYSPKIQEFLDALNKDIIEDHVRNLGFDYYNNSGGRVSMTLDVDECSGVSIETECVACFEDLDEIHKSMSTEEIKNATAENSEITALIKNMIPKGGEICIEMSGEGDSGGVENIYVTTPTEDGGVCTDELTGQAYDALCDAARDIVDSMGFSGFENNEGGSVEITLKVNEQGEIASIDGKLSSNEHPEETELFNEDVIDIKYQPSIGLGPSFRF